MYLLFTLIRLKLFLSALLQLYKSESWRLPWQILFLNFGVIVLLKFCLNVNKVFDLTMKGPVSTCYLIYSMYDFKMILGGSPHRHWNRIYRIRILDPHSMCCRVSSTRHAGYAHYTAWLEIMHCYVRCHAALHAARIWIEAVWRQSGLWTRIPPIRIGFGSKVPCGEPHWCQCTNKSCRMQYKHACRIYVLVRKHNDLEIPLMSFLTFQSHKLYTQKWRCWVTEDDENWGTRVKLSVSVRLNLLCSRSVEICWQHQPWQDHFSYLK